MAVVPAQFLGMARRLRMAVAAEHPAAVAGIDRIALPLRAMAKMRQLPTSGALARAASAWRAIPSAGRLRLDLGLSRSRLSVTEIRAVPASFHFSEWTDDAFEPAIVITKTTMQVSARVFRFNSRAVASAQLHALARRYQRAFDCSDAAIRRDLCALADVPVGALPLGCNVSVPLHEGHFAGVFTQVDDAGQAVRIIAVRSFLSDGMNLRTARTELEV